MTRLAVTAVAVLVILAALALYGRSSGGDEPVSVSTATPTPTAAAPATATATSTPMPPTATPAAPTATPTATASPAPTTSPVTATPTLTVPASADRLLPSSFLQLAAALPGPGLALTNAYEPACPGASVEPIVFAGPDFEGGDRFAVWVFWPYRDRDAFDGEWTISAERRVEPLLAGCEPPNGFVYWNRHLLLWFVGFYGSDVDPASLPDERSEVREHPVIRAFLGLRP